MSLHGQSVRQGIPEVVSVRNRQSMDSSSRSAGSACGLFSARSSGGSYRSPALFSHSCSGTQALKSSLPSPTNHTAVKKVLLGAKRLAAKPALQRLPLTFKILEDLGSSFMHCYAGKKQQASSYPVSLFIFTTWISRSQGPKRTSCSEELQYARPPIEILLILAWSTSHAYICVCYVIPKEWTVGCSLA